MADIAYNPQLHGDPLLHVQAFREPPEMKEQGQIRPMDHDQYCTGVSTICFRKSLERLSTSEA